MRILFTPLLLIVCTFSSLAQTNSDSTKSNEQVFIFVQVMPQFPGGEEAFQKFIAVNLEYPADARAQGIEGAVYVQYVIGKDGTLSDVKIVPGRGLSPSCDQAAIDVFKKSPKWSPALQNGTPVAVKLTQKIHFNLGYK